MVCEGHIYFIIICILIDKVFFIKAFKRKIIYKIKEAKRLFLLFSMCNFL